MSATVLQGDVLAMLATLPDESVNCVVTSPPYWGLRDYGVDGQIGLESTPQEFVAKMVAVFREVRRVLRKDGTLWLNLGDSYSDSGRGADIGSTLQGTRHTQAESRKVRVRETTLTGLRAKNLVGIPWRVAFALQEDGWFLRQDIIWSKPNPMPESVRDRCTKAHEYIFLLSKSERYSYDFEAVQQPSATEMERWARSERTEPYDIARSLEQTGQAPPGRNGCAVSPIARRELALKGTRNRRSVWNISTQPYPEAHFATFPQEIPRICILAGCPGGGLVLDPFAGSGTTLAVALALGRRAVGIELNPDYVSLIHKRLAGITPGFHFEVPA